VLRALLDAIAPPRCAGCGRAGHEFCPVCRLRIAETPLTKRRDVDGVGLILALGAYDGPLRQAILACKYQNRRDVAVSLGALIAARVSPGGEVLVPVPLHPARLAARGYNQARLLAAALALGWRRLARESRLELADALCRVRATSPQSELHLGARETNVRDAFAAGPQARVVACRRVVLVDDVVTTGATLRACAQVLRACGARSIMAICAAAKL